MVFNERLLKNRNIDSIKNSYHYLAIWSEPLNIVLNTFMSAVMCFVINVNGILNEVFSLLKQNPKVPMTLWLSVVPCNACELHSKISFYATSSNATRYCM